MCSAIIQLETPMKLLRVTADCAYEGWCTEVILGEFSSNGIPAGIDLRI